MAYCVECGTKLSDSAKFCVNCGTKVIGRNSGDSEGGSRCCGDIKALCKDLLDIGNGTIRTGKITREVLDAVKKHADEGSGIASYVMGELNFLGLEIDGDEVISYDPDAMMEYLFKAAKAGCHFAQGALGNYLWSGVDGSEDYEDGNDPDSFSWITKAAKNGNVLALHRMTFAYLGGDYGQKVDFEKALECFKSIIEAKDSEAWNQEWIDRASGYLRYLPAIIDGDEQSARKLADWLKEVESDWDWSWGIGDADTESEFWRMYVNS